MRTAAAQTGTNVSTAVANSYLGNTNQYTPDGSLRYDVTGTHSWTDPTTGSKYDIPTWSVTQELSDQNKAIKEQTDAAKMNMAGMASGLSEDISAHLSNQMDPNFNAQQYLQNNPDVAKAAYAQGRDPAAFAREHYQAYGLNEGRAAPGAPQAGDPSQISKVPKAQTNFFNAQQYLQQNPDVRAWAQQTGMTPEAAAQLHYEKFGAFEGRAQNNTGQVQNSLGNYGQQQSTFGDAGDITRSYGPADNFSNDRQRYEDSLMARMNPQLSKERASIEQRLADQGIRYGSAAYQGAMDDYNRQANDARFAAVGQAGSEQQRMNAMAQQLAQFQNSAQGQAFSQAQGRGQFANDAQNMNYQQMLGAGSFANAAQNQAFGQNAQEAGFANAGLAQQLAQAQSSFNAQQTGRNQYMQEAYQARNQPLNEISALMSGSQVSSTPWMNNPQSQIPTTDIAGIINNNFAQQSQNYQSANQNWQSTMGGLLGLGGKIGAAAIMSDRKVKKNIDKIGTIFAAGDKKLPVYEYEYKGKFADGQRHVGPMAQDVERLDPDAVTEIDGIKHILTREMMGGILRAA
jgi:hypothetical protein